jgi:hypothetical protein
VSLRKFDQPTIVARCLSFFRPARSRRDAAPDFLGRCNGLIFERDGFCFAVSLDRDDRAATFTIIYQSRYAGRSAAIVALRPAGSSLPVFSPRIQCGPAGFGVAKFPVAVPARHQCKTVKFDVGADVEYPLGQGREVRFRTGRAVRFDTRFKRLPPADGVFSWGQACGLPWGLKGWLIEHILSRMTTIRLRLPNDVAEETADDAGHVEELWSLPGRSYSSHSA